MSRSRKKAIIKDRPRNYKKSSMYWRRVRSRINTYIRSCKDLENLQIPNPKSIMNDYDYCDYVIDYEFNTWRPRWWSLNNVERSKRINRRK